MTTVGVSIADRITAEIATIFKGQAGQVTRATRFVEDLDAKSVNYVQLIAVLDDAFGIDIPFMELRRRATVGDAIDYVVGLIG